MSLESTFLKWEEGCFAHGNTLLDKVALVWLNKGSREVLASGCIAPRKVARGFPMQTKFIILPLLTSLLVVLIGCAYPAASWQYVQEQRIAVGLPPLEWDDSLAPQAQARAQETANLGSLDHGGFQTMHDTTIPTRYLCEILGRQRTWVAPDRIGQGWLLSPRHAECALGASYRHAALGWVMADGWIYEAMWLTP